MLIILVCLRHVVRFVMLLMCLARLGFNFGGVADGLLVVFGVSYICVCLVCVLLCCV